MKITMDDIDNWFTYHAPSVDQRGAYEEIRDAGRDLAIVVMMNTPSGPDQSAALRKIREAVMTANAAIACHRPDDTRAYKVTDLNASEGPEA